MAANVIEFAQPHASHVIDGAQLLSDTRAFLTRFVAFTTPEQATAVALWIVHTHAFAAAETTPRLSIQSAEKQSGKTRLLEVIELLVAEPLFTASISAAAMFRLIADGPTTLLVDEVDTVFSARGKGREDLRGILNAGYRHGSSVTRVVGSTVERFPVFAPVVLAGIGRLPDTVQDRSIVIRLKRRAPGEDVSKLRRREVEPDAFTLRAAITQWAAHNVAALATMIPDVPQELADRAADVWEPLLAIADAAGGEWPARPRAAAIALSGGAVETATEAAEVVARARALFSSFAVDRVSTADLVTECDDLVDTPKQLAAIMRPLGIAPRVMRQGDDVFRGYLAADFA